MNTQFYKPSQGDTAATVKDGYNDNFRILDTAQEAATSAADAALKAHADKAEIHQTSEQIRAEIVDADIPETLARLAAVDAKDAATLTTAKTYTDTQETVIRTDFAAADATALTTSKTYTDTKVAALVDGAPETLDTLKEVAEALKANEDGAAAMMEVIGTKADAATTAAAIAAKVDKVDGKGLSANDYTDADLAKLAGIADGASNYTLPAATTETLGGIKVGNNLTIDADGRLNASAGGGSGGGGGILVLPYVTPEQDASGAVTNSAAFVTAWGGIISKYIATPDQYALYMEVDGGDGLMLRMPCTMVNMGGGAEEVQWLLSGFIVVNLPNSDITLISSKATVSMSITCSPAGEMLVVGFYMSIGFVTAEGEPNLLSADNAVVVDLSNVDTTNELQLKAAVQPAVAKLAASPSKQCTLRFPNNSSVHATYVSAGTQLLISATGILDITDDPFTDTVPVSYYLLKATVQDGTVQSASFRIKSTNLITDAAISTPHVDYTSLTEQLVPGEFWLGVDGVKRQVYCRTFTGMVPEIPALLLPGAYQTRIVMGGAMMEGSEIPINIEVMGSQILVGTFSGGLSMQSVGGGFNGLPYVITAKYTKL